MLKNDKLHIPITSELKRELKKRAEAEGLSLASYCALVLSKARSKRIVFEFGENK